VFPLQLLGFDVDVVNSVHFSNHTGYEKGFEGDILKGEQLRALFSGLKRNDLLSEIGHILTGYIGSVSFLEAVIDVIKLVQEEVVARASRKVRFVCDPVLGDKGKYYVPVELVQLYREKVIPLAEVVTPNQFEAEQLTGITIRSIDDAIKACHALHEMGPRQIFITSMEFESSSDCNNMTIVASEIVAAPTNGASTKMLSAWRIDCPILPCHFTGTGDLCAALFLAHTAGVQDEVEHSSSSPSDISSIASAMERVINTMFAVLQRTLDSTSSSVRSRELKIIQSQDIILNPPQRFKAQRVFDQ
jgi:pyridoxine kinase